MADPFGDFEVVDDPFTDAEAVPTDKDVSTTMYDDMSYEDAARLYDDFMKDPNVTPPRSGVGAAIYTDPETGEREYIPRPSPRTWKAAGSAIIDLVTGKGLAAARETFTNPEADVRMADQIALGLGESAGATAELAAAGIDKGAETLGYSTDAVGAVRDVAADIDAGDSVRDALLTDAVPAAAAALAGGVGAAKSIPAAGNKLGSILRNIGVGVTGEAAASATVGTDEGTVLLGDDAAFPIAKGLDLGDTNADQVLEQRFNTLAEGLALGSAAAGIASTGIQIGKLGSQFVVEPFMTAARGSNMEKRAINEIMDQLTLVTEASTPEEIFSARQNIADIVEANKEVVSEALSRTDEPLRFNLDTVSALARGADDATADQLASIRSGILQRSNVGSRTREALSRPARALRDETEAYLRQVGGETANDQVATMQRGAQAATDQVETLIDGAEGGVRAAQDQYDAAVDDVVRSINEDLEIGQQIQRLEDLNGTEIVSGPSTSREQVKAGLEDAYGTMRQTKNDLYAQIEGGPVDVGSLYDAFLEADLGELSKKSRDIRRTSPLRELADLLQPRRVDTDVPGDLTEIALDGADPVEASTRLETRDEVVARVEEFFSQNPEKYNFGFFNNEIRNEIGRAADDFFRRGEGSSGLVLRDIVKTIDEDLVDYVAENGDEALAEAARNAKSFYQNEFAPIWRSKGVMEDFAQTYDSTVARGEGFRRGFDEQAGDLTRNVLSGSSPEQVASTVEALRAAGQDAGPVADYMVSDALSKLSGRVRADGIDAVGFGEIEGQFRQYAEALRGTFPEKAQSVDRFVSRLRSAQGNRQALENVLKTAGDNADAAKKRIQDMELSRFLREKSEILGIGPTQNAERAFRDILTGGRSMDRVAALKDEISALPEGRRMAVQDGLETAYGRLLRGKAIGRTQELGGAPRVKVAGIEDSLESVDPQQLIRVGREVFSDKPEVMETIEPLMEVAGMVQRTKEARPISVFSPTAFSQDAQKATNRLIYLTTGPLTRAGTRIRAFLGAAVENMAPDQRAAQVMDGILADPDRFVELARKYNADPANGKAREELLRAMFSGVIKTDVDEEMELLGLQ